MDYLENRQIIQSHDLYGILLQGKPCDPDNSFTNQKL